MKPTNQQSGQNPFEAILSQMGSSGMQGSQRMMNGAQGQGDANSPFAGILQGMQGGQGQQMMQPNPELQSANDQVTPGKAAGSSKFILAALNALQSVLTASSDPEEVQVVRQIMAQLTQLLNKDQAKQDSALKQAMQGRDMGMIGGGGMSGPNPSGAQNAVSSLTSPNGGPV